MSNTNRCEIYEWRLNSLENLRTDCWQLSTTVSRCNCINKNALLLWHCIKWAHSFVVDHAWVELTANHSNDEILAYKTSECSINHYRCIFSGSLILFLGWYDFITDYNMHKNSFQLICSLVMYISPKIMLAALLYSF